VRGHRETSLIVSIFMTRDCYYLAMVRQVRSPRRRPALHLSVCLFLSLSACVRFNPKWIYINPPFLPPTPTLVLVGERERERDAFTHTQVGVGGGDGGGEINRFEIGVVATDAICHTRRYVRAPLLCCVCVCVAWTFSSVISPPPPPPSPPSSSA